MRRSLLASLALACAPASRPTEPPRSVPAVAPSPAPREQPAAPTGQVEEYRPEGETVGVAQCDAYLALYRSCEPELAAEIAAGERRTFRAEAARLKYFHEHDRDPHLPAACETMLTELRRRCLEAP